jgi:hypothetical protein
MQSQRGSFPFHLDVIPEKRRHIVPAILQEGQGYFVGRSHTVLCQKFDSQSPERWMETLMDNLGMLLRSRCFDGE